MRNVIWIFFVAVLVGGCAVGNSHRYDLGDAAFDLETDRTVAVSAVDLRPYVQTGDKTPDFVGLQRGGFGNPFDVTTSSGRPMADDMTTSIVEAMKKSGVRAFGVTQAANARENAAREALLKADGDRYVLFLVREWKADTYMNTALIYDASLVVLKGDGSQSAEKTIRGHDNLGSTFVPADARVHAERAFKQKLEEVINDPSVASALK